ncbi:unnamed protein product, partial [Rodentolepis nana]|uniref:WS_DGAT_C domain-containing protein n=1 Tax=Rodentolepis nana TaxID=102285 RepID=A0A0R3TZC3_RODNA
MVECILPIFEGVLPGNPSVRSLNSATASILGQSLNSATASILGKSGMSESATVHCFSTTDSILGHGSLNSATASILGNRVSISAVLGGSLFPTECIADCESESVTALMNFVSR